MSFSHSSLSAQVKSYLTFLPEEIRQKILEHLHGVIHYEPVIGIMGKSGTGKSSLCNAIFQSRICATHPWTAAPARLIVLPCSSVNAEWRWSICPALVRHRSMIRNTGSFIVSYCRNWIWLSGSCGLMNVRMLPILPCISFYWMKVQILAFSVCSQPCRSRVSCWRMERHRKCPSRQQELSLATVTARVATLFPSSFPVLSVAAPVGWNLPALVSLMIHALPPQATSAVYSHIRGKPLWTGPETRTTNFWWRHREKLWRCRCPIQLSGLDVTASA